MALNSLIQDVRNVRLGPPHAREIFDDIKAAEAAETAARQKSEASMPAWRAEAVVTRELEETFARLEIQHRAKSLELAALRGRIVLDHARIDPATEAGLALEVARLADTLVDLRENRIEAQRIKEDSLRGQAVADDVAFKDLDGRADQLKRSQIHRGY